MREVRWTLTVLLILFIAFRIAGVIDWSWWWVAAPFWIPLALSVAAIAVVRLLVWNERRRMTPEERNLADLADNFRAYGEALRRERRR